MDGNPRPFLFNFRNQEQTVCPSFEVVKLEEERGRDGATPSGIQGVKLRQRLKTRSRVSVNPLLKSSERVSGKIYPQVS